MFTFNYTKNLLLCSAPFCFFLMCVGILFFVPPIKTDVFYPQVFVVREGESIRQVASSLQEEGVVSSASLFIIATQAVGGKILWGSYYLSEPASIFTLAKKMYAGIREQVFSEVLIPEGSNVYEIADIFEEHFATFDRDSFEREAIKRHGYLYPDTYFIAEEDVNTSVIIAMMEEAFADHTAGLFDAYEGTFTKDEIITLASIVELESYRQEDRRKIASVLFNRLEADLPLQVDVSFRFILDKHTFQLTRDDLAVDHPSNTYKYKGIPPVPIGNPSVESIEAVLNPIPSDALYFLADRKGTTYFSRTYNEHLRKKAIYVDSRY